MALYLGFETCDGSPQGECLIFGALCPSKSGLMNKHIVKHIVQTGKTFMELKPRDHAPQTQPYSHVATAKPNAQLDAHAPLISLDNSALHTPVPATGMRGALPVCEVRGPPFITRTRDKRTKQEKKSIPNLHHGPR